MTSIALRGFLFIGLGAIGSFILYLVKRKIERKHQSESVDLDRKHLDLIEAYLSNKDRWESTGVYVSPPGSIAGLLTKSLTPQEWEKEFTTMTSHNIRNVHSTCMWFEAIAVQYPEYEFALKAFRNEFLRWYNAAVQYLPKVFEYMPPQVARVLHAYNHRVTDPTPTNVDGFYSALNDLKAAMDSGEIRVSAE